MPKSVNRFAVILCGLWAPVNAWAADPTWLTGAALQQQLQQPVSWSIDGVPLRDGIYAFGREQHIGVLLDRRVDPNPKLNIQAQQMPIWQLLQQIAQQQHLGLARLGSVCYFGPPTAAARLRTLAELRWEEIRAAPSALAARFARQQPLHWPDLAVPRELIAQLAEENQLQIAGLELVPHDLWAAAQLPPLSLVDRFTLLTVQFELTFNVTRAGDALRLVPIPAQVALTRSYPAGPQAATLAAKWSALIPNAQIQTSGDKLVVRGLLEEHEQISGKPRPAANRATTAQRPVDQDQQRHTVKRAEGPLGDLLAKLAKSFELELRYDEAALQRAGISLAQPVRFSVTEATLDELFAALLKETGCRFRREGRVLYIEPAR